MRLYRVTPLDDEINVLAFPLIGRLKIIVRMLSDISDYSVVLFLLLNFLIVLMGGH